MPISVTCECGKQLQAKDEFAGRRTSCPNCGRELVIPSLGNEPNPYLSGPTFEPGPPKVVIADQPRTSGKAVASLVLGIISIFCCLTSVPGLILGVFGLGEANRNGGSVRGQGLAIAGIITSCLGLFMFIPVGLLIPAASKAKEAARRAQCMNNMKQIGLAIYNFESSNGNFPPQAITDADGKPLLSWRVAILPYVEEYSLYQQFHLDEPWDSPHNKALIAAMPRVYACPSTSTPDEIAAGLTHYQAFAGPGSVMDPAAIRPQPEGLPRGTLISTITDGTSNTILVAESSNPVEWTRPDDMPFTPKGPPPPVGSKHPGGYNVLFADGSVRFLMSTLAGQILESLITKAGGEVIGPGAY
jgi:prepilin-type processing-associated H-X9-DG protein